MTDELMETSTAVTNGIRIIVRCRYAPERSRPSAKHYTFVYTVRIQNEGHESAQLLSRHWLITDNTGKIAEVVGEGVVGEQPILHPGRQFEYTSSATLVTTRGAMRGSYKMQNHRGRAFDAVIAPFLLAPPYSLN